MDEVKRKKLEAKGWRVGTAGEFLELSPEEAEIVELRLALSKAVRNRRLEAKLTQEAAAKLLGSSQSRLAKAEAGDKSVSIDLMLRNLFGLGAKAADLPNILTKSFDR